MLWREGSGTGRLWTAPHQVDRLAAFGLPFVRQPIEALGNSSL